MKVNVISFSSTCFIPRAYIATDGIPTTDFISIIHIVNLFLIIAAPDADVSSTPGRGPSSKGPIGGRRRWSSSCEALPRVCPPPNWPESFHVAEDIYWIYDIGSKHR